MITRETEQGLGLPGHFRRMLADLESSRQRDSRDIRAMRGRQKKQGFDSLASQVALTRTLKRDVKLAPEILVRLHRISSMRDATQTTALANIVEEIVKMWNDDFPALPLLHLRVVDSPGASHCTIRLDHVPTATAVNWGGWEENLNLYYHCFYQGVIAFLECGHTVEDMQQEVILIMRQWAQQKPKKSSKTSPYTDVKERESAKSRNTRRKREDAYAKRAKPTPEVDGGE